MATSSNVQGTFQDRFQVGAGKTPAGPVWKDQGGFFHAQDEGEALVKVVAVAPVAWARLPSNQAANVALAWADLQTESGLSRAGSVWTRTEGLWKGEAKVNVQNTSALSLGVLAWTATGNNSGILDQGQLSVPLSGLGQVTLQMRFASPDTTVTLVLSSSILASFQVLLGSSVVWTRIG